VDKKPALLSTHERRKLAGVTLIHERTIRRWESGADIHIATRKVLDEAARKLGLPVPERPR
jgi:hypothetical protein